MSTLQIVFSTDQNFVFSKKSENKLQWTYPPDLVFFKFITSVGKSVTNKSIIIMGNNTFKSLPFVLPNRIHFVLSRKQEISTDNVVYFKSIDDCLLEAKSRKCKISVIGGLDIIHECLKKMNTFFTQTTIYHSIIPVVCCVNTKKEELQFFDKTNIPSYFTRDINTENTVSNIFSECNVNVYSYRHPEYEYLDLIKHVILNGIIKNNRTSIQTKSMTGMSLRIPLDRFPLVTTKKVSFLNIAKEALWFINGDTNSKTLENQGVMIWKQNTTKDFHSQRIKSITDTDIQQQINDYKDGDAGPIYHHQWRHFSAKYNGCDADYTGQGIDQIAQVIRMIKNDPTSRRIIVSAWNVNDLDKMVLNPCHTLFQFHVDDENKQLSCTLYQRSGDIGLGIPYNISSYALITYIIAHICGLIPKELIIFIADAHIYINHISQLTEQLTREPYEWPSLIFKRQVNDINDIKLTDFELVDYKSHPLIKMDMAV